MTLTARVRNRRIELNAPDDLPDGTEVLVDVTPVRFEKIGITEDEWRDDPEALADWSAWLKTIEPFEITPEEQVELDDYNEKSRQFNLEAVRKQMESELLP